MYLVQEGKAVSSAQLDGGAYVMADHDNEIGMINADMDEVAIADGCCAHVPGIPCTQHRNTFAYRVCGVSFGSPAAADATTLTAAI